MWLRCLFLFAASLVLMVVPARSFEIAVSPARFELEIGKGARTQAIEILNTSDREVHVGVELANFDLDENNKLRVIPPTEQSLDQWIAINPLSLTLPPNARRTLRFAIRPQVQPAPGEHRAVIFLNEGASTTLLSGARVKFRIGVVVYAQQGPHDRRAALHGARAEPGGLMLDIEALGNAHARFKGGYAVWPEARYPGDAAASRTLAAALRDRVGRQALEIPGAALSGLLLETPVLPGTRRQVPQPVDLGSVPGPKRVFLTGMLGDTPVAQSFSLP